MKRKIADVTNEKFDLSIKPIPTDKSKIRQPVLAKAGVIGKLGSSNIMSGPSGSGKSTLLARLLTDKRFYKGYLDAVYLFSPTANGDAIQKEFKIPKHRIITDVEKRGADVLKVILKTQKEQIAKKGIEKVKQIGIIFDDCVGCRKFLRSKPFLDSFIASRHYACTTFICSQAWNLVTRSCRLQATMIYYFKGSASEARILSKEYAPPNWSEKQFLRLIEYATDEDYQFLCINKSVPIRDRFRIGLGQIVDISRRTEKRLHTEKSAITVDEKKNEHQRESDLQRPDDASPEALQGNQADARG